MNYELLVAFLLSVFTGVSSAQYLEPAASPVDPLKEYRQCGAPERDAKGVIKRSSTVLTAYKKYHPCPVTGLSTGSCPGWQINHIIPLAKGGCDAVVNLAWMPDQIKTCKNPYCIDRWERTYYGKPHGIVKFPIE